MNTLKTDGLKKRWIELSGYLKSIKCAEVIPHSRNHTKKIDLSKKLLTAKGINSINTSELEKYIFKNNAVSHGGYLESRSLYSNYPAFRDNKRDIHLGMDIWVTYETQVISPLDAEVYSAADNSGLGNYGPTVILKHVAKDTDFFTLYGHLSQDSIQGLKKGQLVLKGQSFGKVGHQSENGGWPSHLHFQLILELLHHKVDFPGVCSKEDLAFYQSICPDPNIILKL